MQGWRDAGWTILILAVAILVLIWAADTYGQVQTQHLSVIAKKNSGGSGGDGWVQVLYDTSFTETGYYTSSPWYSGQLTYDATNDEIDYDGSGSDLLYQDSVYIVGWGESAWLIENGDSVKVEYGIRNATGNFYMGCWLYDKDKTFGTREQFHGLSTRNNGIYSTTRVVAGSARYVVFNFQFFENSSNTASLYYVKLWKKQN